MLRCPQLRVPVTRTPVGQAERAAACAQTLGPQRAFYTTRDSVEDIEAVRQAIGVEKIALFGVSYGTKVALAYAARYPQRIERLVLDSVVEPTGPGAFSQESIAAIPRVLRTLCAKDCTDITPDPVADVAALVQRMRTRGLRVRRPGVGQGHAPPRPDRQRAAARPALCRRLRPDAARARSRLRCAPP